MVRKKKKEKWYDKIAKGARKAQAGVREFHTGTQTIAGSLEPPDWSAIIGSTSKPAKRVSKTSKKRSSRKRPRRVVTEYY